MTRRTCALCGHSDASDVTAIDGRTVPPCTHCLAPAPTPKRYWQMARAPWGARTRGRAA